MMSCGTKIEPTAPTMMLRNSILLTLLLGVLHCSSSAVDPSRALDISNESNQRLQVYWLNPKTGEAVRFADVQSGHNSVISSFVNHTFMIRDDEDECNDAEENCHIQYITVNDGPKRQLVHVKEGLAVQYDGEDDEISLHDSQQGKKVVDDCKTRAAARLAAASVDHALVLDDLVKCVENGLARLLESKNEELAIESKDRRDLADKLENYTCADNSLTTTPPKEIRTWEYEGTVREVHVLHERRASQIHVLQNFISPEECQAIQEAAEPKLHRGTVADGAGGHKLSEHRKAFQAGLAINWGDEENPITRVMRRVYNYTNDATGYNLDVDGQEDLMSIQYFGHGENDPTPDQYRPHCDGDCDGKIHKEGGRVATMVMYCNVPDKGGFTNFGLAGVTAKPQVGAAAFFSYMDPVTKIKDTGFTTHSGCPVIEGTKRIAVHWMRLGVNSENPWDSFNTLTIKKSEAEDC